MQDLQANYGTVKLSHLRISNYVVLEYPQMRHNLMNLSLVVWVTFSAPLLGMVCHANSDFELFSIHKRKACHCLFAYLFDITLIIWYTTSASQHTHTHGKDLRVDWIMFLWIGTSGLNEQNDEETNKRNRPRLLTQVKPFSSFVIYSMLMHKCFWQISKTLETGDQSCLFHCI